MSGTSLDGLDMCAVEFLDNAYQIIASRTYVYDSNVVTKLSKAHTLSALELAQLHVDYGTFCAEIIREFITSLDVKPDYIASHGHTVFHTPHTGLTLQIGSGAHIAAITAFLLLVIFRTLDVAFGGQGAPLVPIGDEFLFSEYEYCLNIGGFANVSCKHNNTRIAWDICATNICVE
jgi:anhydro-N-acetylmuramic acid kinase